MKLDFAKAYDKVDWPFLFSAMDSFGFLRAFIDMTRLLFLDSEASVKVNGSPSSSFKIMRGGPPRVPFGTLFIPYYCRSAQCYGA
jgi:hypothetical protein